jgi:uncharacterized protein (DUF1015 family)
MAKIVPFRGVRYNLSRVDSPAAVVAPPYDVISHELQENLYHRSPHNVVRLDLAKTTVTDTDGDNRYTRAAIDFQAWQQDGVLVRDDEPSIYLYDQKYPVESGELVVRKGFIALTRLEDFSTGMVKPHEKTLAGPKADRLLLTKACGAQLSPIFSLYSDPCCVLESLTRKEKERVPDVEVADDDGVFHLLWRVTEPTIVKKSQELLDKKPLFIADGHHRYETAINYRDFMREKNPSFSGKELFNYVLMYFANMEDQGLMIFPTHRLVFNLPDFHLDSILVTLQKYFEVETQSFDPADAAARMNIREQLRQRGEQRHTLALYAGGETVYFLGLRDEKEMDRFFEPRAPKALRTLDVSILHRLILEDTLGITGEAQEQQTNLKYVKNFEEPFSLVRDGKCQLSFLMNPTRMSEVRDVANAGEKMPQKSTYFYPKLLTGLVINKIVEGERAEE